MAMLVNTNAALKTVKGEMKQLFILQSQVNVMVNVFFFFILSPFLNYTFEFYAQVLLKLILSSRIHQLHITRRFSSFVV